MTRPAVSTGPTVFADLESLLAAGRTDLGCTDWYAVDRTAVEQFLAATGGRPLGPDADVPPLMLLAVTNRFMPQLLEVRGASSGINYGTGAVRFPGSARPGDRIRGCAVLVEAIEVPGGVQTTVEMRVEAADAVEPVCVVESLSRWLR